MSKIDLTASTAASLAVGGFAAIVLSIVWGGFWSGLTLSTLWGWFVAPLFGLPAITILQAYGLALVVRSQRVFRSEKSKDSFGELMAKSFILPPFATALMLGVGWVAKSWM